MGSIEVSHLSWSLPGGQVLLDDVSFRVGEGEHVALVGANGAGKSTIMRLVAGTEKATSGTITVQGSLGVMTQLVGSLDETTSVRDLYVSLSAPEIQEAAARLDRAERAMADGSGDGMAYASYYAPGVGLVGRRAWPAARGDGYWLALREHGVNNL